MKVAESRIQWIGGSDLPESKIIEAEKEFGFSFPQAFRTLLQKNDGGRPECWIVPFCNPRGGNLDIRTELCEIISLKSEGGKISPFTMINRKVRSHTTGYVIFADDIGGNSFAFDFTKGFDPTIVLIPAFEFDPIYVAENYNEFTNSAMTSDLGINSEIS
ncbi:SMI1/KNR4 family protein [Bosea sp. RAC05]|uniref:SMI1/KNR4 family protein n=1 Tax=Bosea sp. RAC05 TaxID=1842539 RepID=UPI0009F45DE6|nr:SMI1/KNR4 family protein [Bosea sp. RAC05]